MIDVASMIVILMGQVCVGSVAAMNVTLVGLKQLFDLTQTETELLLAAVLFGHACGVPTGVVMDRYGHRWAALIGLCTNIPGFSVLYLATFFPEFFHQNYWILLICLFLIGHGLFAVFTVTWTTGVRQVSDRSRGMLMGAFKFLVLGSPGLFALIYNTGFINGHLHDPENQNIGGFILLLFVFVLTTNVLMMIVLKGIRKLDLGLETTEVKTLSSRTQSQDTQRVSSTNKTTERSTLLNNKQEHIPLRKLLVKPSFLLFLLGISLSEPIDAVLYGNIGIITQSANLEQLNTAIMVTSRVLICLGALLSGGILLGVPGHTGRYVVLLLNVLFIVISCALLLCIPENVAVLFVGIGLESLATGVLWTVGAGVIFAEYGAVDFGRNWGLCIMFLFVFIVIYCLVAGLMYDKVITDITSRTCIGTHCVRNWYILLLVSSLLSLVSFCTLCLVSRRKKLKQGKIYAVSGR